jgi:hypothetical protein
MMNIRRFLAVILFAFQILVSLTIYIYFAHRFSVIITILVAFAETALAMSVFDKLFRAVIPKEPVTRNVPHRKAILKTIPQRKKIGI